jgi:hypothetical protein
MVSTSIGNESSAPERPQCGHHGVCKYAPRSTLLRSLPVGASTTSLRLRTRIELRQHGIWGDRGHASSGFDARS